MDASELRPGDLLVFALEDERRTDEGVGLVLPGDRVLESFRKEFLWPCLVQERMTFGMQVHSVQDRLEAAPEGAQVFRLSELDRFTKADEELVCDLVQRWLTSGEALLTSSVAGVAWLLMRMGRFHRQCPDILELAQLLALLVGCGVYNRFGHVAATDPAAILEMPPP